MSRILRYIAVTLITFGFGVGVFHSWHLKVSLEEISKNPRSYDGRLVTVESYVYADEDGWYMGEPYEKFEVIAILDMDDIEAEHLYLKGELQRNFTWAEHKRARVRVAGRVFDNCLSSTCCFARSITLRVDSFIQLEAVEDYSRPSFPEGSTSDNP